MIYTAVVEIPKGCDRRIHKSNETSEFVDFGPTKNVIPVNDGKMPVCYGFLKGIINKEEGDEVDCLIFSNKEYKTGYELEVEIVGMINREDGDHKVVVHDKTTSINEISEIDDNLWKLILDYFGYKHKIVSVEDNEKTIIYLNACI